MFEVCARSPEGTRTQIVKLEEVNNLRRQSILPKIQNRKQDRTAEYQPTSPIKTLSIRYFH